jgi:hypothetical protein
MPIRWTTQPPSPWRAATTSWPRRECGRASRSASPGRGTTCRSPRGTDENPKLSVARYQLGGRASLDLTPLNAVLYVNGGIYVRNEESNDEPDFEQNGRGNYLGGGLGLLVRLHRSHGALRARLRFRRQRPDGGPGGSGGDLLALVNGPRGAPTRWSRPRRPGEVAAPARAIGLGSRRALPARRCCAPRPRRSFAGGPQGAVPSVFQRVSPRPHPWKTNSRPSIAVPCPWDAAAPLARGPGVCSSPWTRAGVSWTVPAWGASSTPGTTDGCCDWRAGVGDLAQAEDHHPDLELVWGRLSVSVSTHSIGGLSRNDFVLAARIDLLARESSF